MEAVHTTTAIHGIIVLIIVVDVDPVNSLALGSIYPGLAAGLGFDKTIATTAQGFGAIMAEVGLLIGFGVLLGSLLFAIGALQRLVELLLGCSAHVASRTPSARCSPRSSRPSTSMCSWCLLLRSHAPPPLSSAATASA